MTPSFKSTLAAAFALSVLVALPAQSVAENIFERTGNALGGVVSATGKAVGEVAQTTGQAVGEVACGVGDGAVHIADPSASGPCEPQTVVLPEGEDPYTAAPPKQ